MGPPLWRGQSNADSREAHVPGSVPPRRAWPHAAASRAILGGRLLAPARYRPATPRFRPADETARDITLHSLPSKRPRDDLVTLRAALAVRHQMMQITARHPRPLHSDGDDPFADRHPVAVFGPEPADPGDASRETDRENRRDQNRIHHVPLNPCPTASRRRFLGVASCLGLVSA